MDKQTDQPKIADEKSKTTSAPLYKGITDTKVLIARHEEDITENPACNLVALCFQIDPQDGNAKCDERFPSTAIDGMQKILSETAEITVRRAPNTEGPWWNYVWADGIGKEPEEFHKFKTAVDDKGVPLKDSTGRGYFVSKFQFKDAFLYSLLLNAAKTIMSKDIVDR